MCEDRPFKCLIFFTLDQSFFSFKKVRKQWTKEIIWFQPALYNFKRSKSVQIIVFFVLCKHEHWTHLLSPFIWHLFSFLVVFVTAAGTQIQNPFDNSSYRSGPKRVKILNISFLVHLCLNLNRTFIKAYLIPDTTSCYENIVNNKSFGQHLF